MLPCGKENTEVWIMQKIEKEKGNSYQKIKRSLDEWHTQTHGSLIETF